MNDFIVVGRGVTLTDAGRRLALQCESVLLSTLLRKYILWAYKKTIYEIQRFILLFHSQKEITSQTD